MRLKTLLFIFALVLLAQGVFTQEEDGAYWHYRGLEYFYQGDYASAIECILKAKEIDEHVLGKEHPDYVASLSNLGMLYEIMRDYTIAEQYLLEVKDIRELVMGKEHPDYATSLHNLGILYHSMGDFPKAEQYYLESITIKERMKEDSFYGDSLYNLGVLYFSTGDYNKAEQYILKGKDVYENEPEQRWMANYADTLNILGLINYKMGNLAIAEQYYLDTIFMYETLLLKEYPNYNTLLTNLGLLFVSIGDYAKAEHYLLEGKDIREHIFGKEEPGYVASLINLGFFYLAMEDYVKAEQYLLEGKEICESVSEKERFHYDYLLNHLGRLYIEMGDFSKAEYYLLEGKEIFENVLGKDHPDYSYLLNALGKLNKDIEDYIKAEHYYLESIAINERLLGKEHPNYVSSLNDIYTLYLSSQNFKHALKYKQEANLMGETLINRNFSFLSGQQREIYWKVYLKYFELTYSLSHFYPAPDNNALSYDNALFTKGLLLRTTNAVRDSIYNSSDETLISEFEELRSVRQQIGNLQQSRGNEAYIKELEQQADVLDKSLTKNSAAFREFQEDLSICWENIRDSLLPGEAAIEFVSFKMYDKKWTDKILYAAIVLRNDMEAPVWVPLCEEDVLADIFKNVEEHAALVEPEDKPFEYARILCDYYSAEIYFAIWKPLEETLAGIKTVYYSPSGLLHKISFAAIPVGEVWRLIDVYDLNLVSTTREVVYKKNRATQKPDSAVIYGGLFYELTADRMRQEALLYQDQESQFSSTSTEANLPTNVTGGGAWNYLFQTAIEGFNIQRILTENNVHVVLYNGASGNKESFKNLDGKQTGIIHLATHGFFIENIEKDNFGIEHLERMGFDRQIYENPLMRSGLILAGGNNAWRGSPVEGVENGILFADDVAHMNLLGTELVVLSASETGLGDIDNTEGVFGLQRAFKLAGAQTLIMSLWDVSDKQTRELMEAFYEGWLSGTSKQDAFKEAQKQIRSKYPEPFYWAAFVLMD
jgi:CHAT domain-containing protein/tetratricopeptide (TPR) repeat protein